MSDLDIVPVHEPGLGNHSYLVGVGGDAAAVVDPVRDPALYARLADASGWRIRWAVETHLHADFVSGSRELAAAGATVALPAARRVAFPTTGLDDGDEFDLDGLTLEAVATPGHTPEHLAYLLRDGDRPLALFSGGALIPGGVARPDLLGAADTEPLARAAYRSLRDRLLTLPDALPVYPTHGAGSFCSTGGSTAGNDPWWTASPLPMAEGASLVVVSPALGLRELVPDDTSPGEAAAFLHWLKRERIAQRIIGPFGWSHVGRAFDGAQYVWSGKNTNVTAIGVRPTRGASRCTSPAAPRSLGRATDVAGLLRPVRFGDHWADPASGAQISRKR